MNRPPPVTFPVGRCPALAWALVGAWALALLPTLAALALHPPARAHVMAWTIALAASAPGLWLAWRFWRDQKVGDGAGDGPSALLWNGAEWLLEKDQRNGVASTWLIAHPGIRLDGQRWLLLRATAAHGQRRRAVWLWAARAADPAHWHALRCALYAPDPVLAPAPVSMAAA